MKRHVALFCLLLMSSVLMGFDWPWTDEKSMEGSYSSTDGRIVIHFAKVEKAKRIVQGKEIVQKKYKAVMTFLGETGTYSYEKLGNALILHGSASFGDYDATSSLTGYFTILNTNRIRFDSYTIYISYGRDWAKLMDGEPPRPPETRKNKNLGIILSKQ